jgi:hypothetical protein
MELCQPCLEKYVWGIRMPGVLRVHVRFVYNRMEGKLDVVILKEYESVRMVPKTLCSNIFDCNWTIGVNFETKSSSPPLSTI